MQFVAVKEWPLQKRCMALDVFPRRIESVSGANWKLLNFVKKGREFFVTFRCMGLISLNGVEQAVQKMDRLKKKTSR